MKHGEFFNKAIYDGAKAPFMLINAQSIITVILIASLMLVVRECRSVYVSLPAG